MAEEHRLERADVGTALSAADQDRLDEVGVQLDRCWDLLSGRMTVGLVGLGGVVGDSCDSGGPLTPPLGVVDTWRDTATPEAAQSGGYPNREATMSFNAKRLRVTLPWNDAVPESEQETTVSDDIIKGQCLDWASWVYGSCADFFTQALVVVSADRAVVDAEQLAVLRRQLEAQLTELNNAEQELKDRDSTQ